jgi:predicted transcriptional regulator
VNRPELGKIFTGGVLRDRGRRDQKVEEAVERHGYTQREVADFLGLHFTSVSRIMNQRSKMKRK